MTRTSNRENISRKQIGRDRLTFKGWVILILVIFSCQVPNIAKAQFSDILDVGGYLKELGQLSVDNGLSTYRYDNILHHRLETEWSFTENFELNADLRTRFLTGYTIDNTPGLGALYENDPNLIDMAWVWVDSDNALIHSQIDRLHLSYFNGPVEIYAGRQRINWGKTYVWNPNDLFNNYAFLDFDYEERPGVDAISAIYNLDFASSIETAVKLDDSFDEMVIAGMFRGNWKQYDYQVTGGHYYDKLALGVGWAGYIKDAGFKGEVTYFQPEEDFLQQSGSITTTIGFDYMFSNSVYSQAEFLYNGGYQKQGSPLFELIQPPSADNLFIAKTGYFLNASYPLTPLTNISGGILGSFTRKMVILIPQISHSLTNNIDLLVLAQLLKGPVFSDFVETPNVLYFRLKWSY